MAAADSVWRLYSRPRGSYGTWLATDVTAPTKAAAQERLLDVLLAAGGRDGDEYQVRQDGPPAVCREEKRYRTKVLRPLRGGA